MFGLGVKQDSKLCPSLAISTIKDYAWWERRGEDLLTAQDVNRGVDLAFALAVSN